MPWDSDKSTAADPDNPQADEQLTANEWDNHVSEGHFPSGELNFGVDGSGDPVITDPQNGGQTVMRYDRSSGSWVIDALEADQANIKRQDGFVYADNYNTFNDAIAAVSDGDTLVLPNSKVSGSYTIDNDIAVTGPGAGFRGGLNASITCNGRVRFHDMQFVDKPSLTINGRFSAVLGCECPSGLTISVNADNFRFIAGLLCTVEFKTGTSDGIVDGCSGVSVIDNGSNTIGDIS